MTAFQSLSLKEWRQFDQVNISFHPRLTVITGANGTGKTTLLNLLNRHYGWNQNFVSTPERDEQTNLKYSSNLWNTAQTEQKNDSIDFGSITYSDNTEAKLNLPIKQNNGQYTVNIQNLKQLCGLHIPSHKPVFHYKTVQQIPTIFPEKEKIFQTHLASIQKPFRGEYVDKSPNTLIKETLISLAVFGEGNSHVTPNSQSLRLFNEFQEILRNTLPQKLGFRKLQIENLEVVLITDSGNFSLDAASGGVAAILDLVWQIYMSNGKETPSVVTIDEPENHLHPTLQKTLLPNLIKAFPETQFIVTTHNPLIVTSVPDSKVYILDYNPNQRVYSHELDFVNKASDANETLRDVLGLPTASPIWVEEKIDELVAKYASQGLTKELVEKLKSEMIHEGLSSLFPDTLSKIS